MDKDDRVRFIGWSDDAGSGCVYPLLPNDTGKITEVITDSTLWPGASRIDPVYEVMYRKGNGHSSVPFKIVHFEEEIELVIVSELEEILVGTHQGS